MIGRLALRQVTSRCLECQKIKGKSGKQLIADLPEERVTGVESFGSSEVKKRGRKVKRYGCILTYLAVRAFHIEIAHGDPWPGVDYGWDSPREQWSVGKIVKIFSSDDGLVRAVNVNKSSIVVNGNVVVN